MGKVPPAEGPGRELTRLVASAPGKLILMGEHAVVYGEPALVAAVDLRLRARFEPAGGADAERGSEASGSPAPEAEVSIVLPQLGHETLLRWREIAAYAAQVRAGWERFAASPDPAGFARLRGPDPAHLVKVALGEAVERVGESGGPPLRLEVDSDLPVGSGFGSSAALAVAVGGGYLAWRGRDVPAGELEALALEVERRQHGTPSGIDAAAAVRGGLVWAERDGDGELRFRGLRPTGGHLARFRVFDTGTPPQSTGEVVAAVRARLDAEPELRREIARMGRLTRRFRELLLSDGGGDEVVEVVRGFERGLEALGVVPGSVREIARAVEERRGAAKVSGAGALEVPSGAPAGAGSLLVYHPEPERIEGWELLERLPGRWTPALGASGFRVERERLA